MERFINKIDGSESKLDLYTFLKIRKTTIKQYLSENNIDSIESLDLFIKELESESSHFNISNVFKNEARELFPVVLEQTNDFVKEDINISSSEQEEAIPVVVVKPKKKKSQNPDDNF